VAKTIKEIADELVIDKQKVYRYIKQNHINDVHNEAHQRCGVKYYDEAAEAIIKQGISTSDKSGEAHRDILQNHINDAVNEVVIDMLRKELEIKNEQIHELNARLAESNAALVAAQQTAQAAQALHAGMIQQQLLGEADPSNREKQPAPKRNWFQRLFVK
jgi:hypothetical protein